MWETDAMGRMLFHGNSILSKSSEIQAPNPLKATQFHFRSDLCRNKRNKAFFNFCYYRATSVVLWKTRTAETEVKSRPANAKWIAVVLCFT